MRAPVIAALLLTLSLPTPARADEEHHWQFETRAAYAFLGHRRTTGGIMPQVAALHIWDMGGWSIGVGADLGVFGFGDDLGWYGVLTGPVVSTESRRVKLPADLGEGSAGFTVSGDVGRVPTCNDWGYCMRYWGVFPAASIALRYYPAERAHVVLALSTRYVSTWGWEGVSWEPSIGVGF